MKMASMEVKDCSYSSNQTSVMTVEEKGSRNKRKFRADPPLADPNKIFPSPRNECTSFEFAAEKLEIPSSHGHANSCDMCCMNCDKSDALKLDLRLSCAVETLEMGPRQPQEETEASSNEHNGADWSNLTESQLEELVLNDLDAILKSAIKKIIASGYSEEIATKAVLRSGLCYGCKDTASNIVDNTLAFLRSDQVVDPSREHCFEDLQQMEKYILAELVCLLKEVRPFFSTGDAMWCLLICDMNVPRACAMDSGALGSFLHESTANENSSDSVKPQLRTEPKISEPNTPITHTPNPSVAYTHNSPSEPPNTVSSHGGHIFQSEAPATADVTNLKLETSFVPNGLDPIKVCQNPVSNTNDKLFSVAGISRPSIAEEKFVGSRKVSGITKREYILRQKSMHLEKHYRTQGSKGAPRARKPRSFGSFVLDEKRKAVADFTGVNVKNPSFKASETVCFDAPQNSVNYNLSTSTEFTSMPTFSLEGANGSFSLAKSSLLSSLPVTDTELSLSLPANADSNSIPVSYDVETVSCSYAGVSNDKSLGQWVPLYKKDIMIMKLVQRVRESQNQLHEWTEWANQKVMQAAGRLSQDKAELKTLRQEREEFERLKKEKQTLEENTMKKLSEMENAMVKASGQVERANFAVRRLHVENSALRQEMEAAKLHAAESAARCQEVSKREKSTLMKFQLREKQKTLLQEELGDEKRKLIQLQKELKQAKDVQDQVEARWKQEEKAKEELLAQAGSFRKEREQIQDSAKSTENMIKSKAANNLQKYKDDIERLQKEISQIRLKNNSSKIAAHRCGMDLSYAGKLADWRNSSVPKDSSIPYILEDITANGGVKRERECVMCLSEEISVIFLPCAHQVVCTMCNELHEKGGMKDCPSCRCQIQRRICVRYALS
ncbi:E3 ubiquitin- ligase RF298 [Olea europaea subsp. europaea]|uniref:E3 ubiquitin- ligase RF298 n=1 Tax=Olea europaea subsp. europaea TaxID=158383 RepID=A0A8S0U044_OLEEU|nr:E3 ubiquitin- ligase RF298 [Olea europaea subsp. europaea]